MIGVIVKKETKALATAVYGLPFMKKVQRNVVECVWGKEQGAEKSLLNLYLL